MRIERAPLDAVKSMASHDEPLIVHQDSFAAAYDDDEYILFGMALKFAGLHGVTVHVIGKGGETF